MANRAKNPLAFGYSYAHGKGVHGNENGAPSTHAEMDLLRNFTKHNRHRRGNKIPMYDLFVARVGKKGNIGMSRPCKDCLVKLAKCPYKIHTVYYTTNDGTIAVVPFDVLIKSKEITYSVGTIKRHNRR